MNFVDRETARLAYEKWMRENPKTAPLTQKAFIELLKEKGFTFKEKRKE